MGSSVRVGGGRVDRLVVKVSRVGVGPVSGCCVCSVQIEGCWACPAPRVGSGPGERCSKSVQPRRCESGRVSAQGAGGSLL